MTLQVALQIHRRKLEQLEVSPSPDPGALSYRRDAIRVIEKFLAEREA